MTAIPPGGEVNEIIDLLAAEDLMTALVKFADAGEVLADRCRQTDHLFLAVGLARQMQVLHAEVAHEVSKAKA